jgi:hypothetical protein
LREVIVPQIAETFHVTPQQQHSRCNNLELVGATSGQNELLLEQTDATTLDTITARSPGRGNVKVAAMAKLHRTKNR